MAQETILGGSKLIGFVPTVDPVKARAFYEGVLGLRLTSDESPFALVFDADGIMLRVTIVPEYRPAPFTVLGWSVKDIQSAVEQLTARGVVFQRYSGMNDADPHGVWNAPGGARVAWFKDPDGNLLSLTQFS
jgi:catechol 2,3-dioxygenase-like lactoylglutathione lyase family enzyme